MSEFEKHQSHLIAALTKVGLENKGTDIGGLMQWAVLHIENTMEALEEANSECDNARSERDAVIRTLEAARTAHSAMNEALRCDILVNQYQTCAADFTSHVNIMMAYEVEPYHKKKRVKK